VADGYFRLAQVALQPLAWSVCYDVEGAGVLVEAGKFSPAAVDILAGMI
jgi:hypothetical protein